MPLSILNNINPIKVTGTTSDDTEILATTVLAHIKFIRWYKPSTDGHLCNVTDGQGNTIMKMNAEAADDTQMWPIYTSFYGIRCDDMDSGELYIHIV
ncbi:hypothetical protein KAR91_23300 [Candidatus Pacearchaeota archaeon]|nr:hypothetical protein [Candidatus Pacearchaeota archaeon]